MNAIEEWLKANAEFCATTNEYRIDKGGCATIFKITEFDTISMEWFDEYGEESFCHLTIDDFIKEYML
jgi:hypothetical protein